MAGNHYDTIIVGTGPAGLTAAIYGQRLGMEVVVFGDIPGGNLYMIDRLMNFPGFVGGIPGAQFGATLYAQAQSEGVFLPMTRLDRLDHRDHVFVGTDVNNQHYEARSAIVSCGVIPRMLQVPNADKPGIYFCSLCDGPLFRNRKAVLAVIGGGSMAGQEALSLSNIADRVLLIYRGDKLKMEAVMRKAIEKKANIEVLLDTELIAFKGEERVDGIVVSTGAGPQKELPVDGVFMAVGWGPNLEMLNIAVEKTPEGYIKTDEKLMSSLAGLFAAGDVRDTDIRQVITACADGARAASYVLEYLEGLQS